MLGKGQCKICDKKIMTWNSIASLSGLIWESPANTGADMENIMY